METESILHKEEGHKKYIQRDCYDERVRQWRKIDSEKFISDKTCKRMFLERDWTLQMEWNTNGLHWYTNFFDYGSFNLLKQEIIDKLEEVWPYLLWNSWDNAYSKKFAKAYVWTDRIATNYREYKQIREVESSNYILIEPYPSESIEWINNLTERVTSILGSRKGVDMKQLKLISVNVNVCCDSGLTIHKDTIRNDGYGDLVVNLIVSGGGYIVVSASKKTSEDQHCLWLGSGDLYVISGSSRFSYYHGVQTFGTEVKNVALKTKGILKVPFNPAETRISLTFRYYYDRPRKIGEMFDIDL
ncbi:hypothetical protein MP638_002740 [Amoeboaphelidium occidentale]|nr:hypothetical protein MP638_002740 [Amoeboaphelidium occidentale]